jgi:hypothetical protein
MREHELYGLDLMGAQIRFEPGKFGGGKLVRAAVIEDGEVSLLIVEAVVRRMAGIFLEEAF